MCEPVSIAIAALTLGTEVASELNKASAQNKVSKANTAAALQSLQQSNTDISFQESQKTAAAGLTIQQADRNARSTKALAQVSAGAAGVGGISVEALMGDIDNKLGQFKQTTNENLSMAIDQLQRDRVKEGTIAQERIDNVQPANPLATGIAIAGEGLSFYGQIHTITSPPKG